MALGGYVGGGRGAADSDGAGGGGEYPSERVWAREEGESILSRERACDLRTNVCCMNDHKTMHECRSTVWLIAFISSTCQCFYIICNMPFGTDRTAN